MKVHLELAQESRRGRLLEAESIGHIGCVIYIQNTQCGCTSAVAGSTRSTTTEFFDRSKYKFVRLSPGLSRESFLLNLERPHELRAVSNLCLAAHRSEEFFLIANATDQWLRTVITGRSEDLHPEIWTEAEASWSKVIRGITIHSNVLPYDPYWSKLRAGTKDGSSVQYFPSYLLKEALEEGKTLKTKLLERKVTGKELCEIGKQLHGYSGRSCGDGNCEAVEQPSLMTSKLFREIQAADVELVRVLHAYGSGGDSILLVSWRGGQFVQKAHKGDQTNFDMELEVVKRFSHPHIVYSFGKLDGIEDGIRQSSYFMEYMSNDLLKFIVERIDRVVGDNKPPFLAHDAVDVLSQVAKAMRHMHQENVNVVHCDLKSNNILISEIETSDNVKHYLVKVVDFGSARFGNSDSSGSSSAGCSNFIPGNGTTNYSAPEVLKQRNDKALLIEFPHKIDVYSFGIVAFEILTGILTANDALYMRSPRKFKKAVIEGTWRPPLRAECEKHKEYFIQDKEFISLIERCWHEDPSQRPCFVEICEELNKVRVRIPEQILQSDHPPRQVNPIMKCFQGFNFTRKK